MSKIIGHYDSWLTAYRGRFAYIVSLMTPAHQVLMLKYILVYKPRTDTNDHRKIIYFLYCKPSRQYFLMILILEFLNNNHILVVFIAEVILLYKFKSLTFLLEVLASTV